VFTGKRKCVVILVVRSGNDLSVSSYHVRVAIHFYFYYYLCFSISY
jgi:hypothetical protein